MVMAEMTGLGQHKTDNSSSIFILPSVSKVCNITKQRISQKQETSRTNAHHAGHL